MQGSYKLFVGKSFLMAGMLNHWTIWRCCRLALTKGLVGEMSARTDVSRSFFLFFFSFFFFFLEQWVRTSQVKLHVLCHGVLALFWNLHGQGIPWREEVWGCPVPVKVIEATAMHCCRTRPGLPFPRSEVQPNPAIRSCSPRPFISVMMHLQLRQACTAQQVGLGEHAPQEDPAAWHCSVLSSTSPLLGQQRAEPTFSTAMRHQYLLLNPLAVRSCRLHCLVIQT